MSHPDELHDIEEQLRQGKPRTEPLSPAHKARLRSQLLEKHMQSQQRFSFAQLGTAVVALLLVVGLPLYFWLVQTSVQNQGTASQPSGIAAQEEETVSPTIPPTLVPTASPIPAGGGGGGGDGVINVTPTAVPTAMPVNFARVVGVNPEPGSVIDENSVIELTLAYGLQTLDEATITAKLTHELEEGAGIGVGMATTDVTASEGTATLQLRLEEPEVLQGETAVLSLNLLVSPTGEDAQPLFIDFPAGMSWVYGDPANLPTPTPIGQQTAVAEVTNIGEAIPVEEEGIPLGAVIEVPITADYELQGYDEALLVIGFSQEDENGSSHGSDVTKIVSGNGSRELTLRLPGKALAEGGQFADNVTFFVQINAYSEVANAYINVYPGDVTVDPFMANLPYPYPSENVQLLPQGIRLDEAAAEEITISVPFNYALSGVDEGQLTAEILRQNGELLSTAEAALSNEETSSVISFTLANDAVEVDEELTVMMQLEGGEETAVAQRTFSPADFSSPEPDDSLWIVSVEEVDSPNSALIMIELTVGYQLDPQFSEGLLGYTMRFGNSGGGGGGGGGGGEALTPGIGLKTWQIGFSPNMFGEGQTWQELIELTATLDGKYADGRTQTLGSATWNDTD